MSKIPGVYWNELTPEYSTVLAVNLIDKALKKGTKMTVKIRKDEFSLQVPCLTSTGDYHYLDIRDLILSNSSLVLMIKMNRRKWLKRGLISEVKGFDMPL